MKHKKLLVAAVAIAGVYAIAKAVAKKHTEDKSINADNPHLKAVPSSHHQKSAEDEKTSIIEDKQKAKHNIYTVAVKPALDQILSFGGLVVLSPLYAAIALAIKIDDSGSVFFSQKRIGKDKTYFMCHKFRTMRMDTPHDVPTHMLSNPDQYITKVGRVLRRTSLDELPQIWDIFRGRMSVIGPRPALWNQDDLVAERDRYGANNVLPGLTGLAQINGRDELEIPDKAKLDGEYTAHISFGMDAKCFVGTIKSVIAHDGVVEGGTSEMKKTLRHGVPEDDPVSEFGCDMEVSVGRDRKVRVLITGAGSYIGESFRSYAKEHYPENFTIDTLDMLDGAWRDYDFSSYDCVYHVAGIAHADVGNVDEATKEKYYAVNTDLAIEVAEKANSEGVKQFIFMSSMIVYGGKEYINRYTKPSPANFYGDSKWQADKGVRSLSDENFAVAVLRPPMIYGKGSKGNYPMLAKIAKLTPLFPEYENKRSMLYIKNLCEFLCQVMLAGVGGIWFPQNGEFSNTAEMVKNIAAVSGSKTRGVAIFNPAVSIARMVPGKIGNLADKAFGSSWYDQEISQYSFEYQILDLKTSIERTER